MRHHFRSPLARWGFTILATVACLTGQLAPFLVTTALAAYSWRCRPRTRR